MTSTPSFLSLFNPGKRTWMCLDWNRAFSFIVEFFSGVWCTFSFQS